MGKLKTGCMPHTDFRYEEFEGLLGSYALSFAPLKTTGNAEDLRDYNEAMEILKGFSQKYDVQAPDEAIAKPRASNTWGRPHTFSNFSLIDMMSSFWKDFGVGYLHEKNQDNPQIRHDASERNRLGRVILRIFDRYKVASVGYDIYDGKRIPVRLQEWNKEKEFKTLADIVLE